ncbi:type VI secretion system protein ImpL [Paraburkholderia sp. BL23I1N1]|uniref:type VI secretion system membrane subunit TssM n=1 Tax=Paraburkholderia sp. BL23I1N1 TaxID=1938802 RepID=UPI000E76B237|nr:type VI secretion system membrane subunit TssM [Paraburkholderia sp. BL23I1N1]RKE36304.1 type VI secretion system protein ImpL [Paraburkholderia sp. BL23I1N1]
MNLLNGLNGLISGLRRPAVVSLAGVLALSALVWFEGPLFAFDGRAPLESESRRWLVVAIIFACWALWWGTRFVKTRIASSNFVRGLVADALDPANREPSPARKAAAADLEVLRTRFEEAMKTLRHVQGPSEGKGKGEGKMRGVFSWLNLCRRTLYDLPWYMFVGAPGAGKTTALVHSGLNFPLADRLGAQAIGGVGGTRNCDWWFTDDAVLLDTAGRFTTQDSHEEADRGAWLGFLALLRKYRPRRPLNGVMAVVSASDLLQQSDKARAVHAASVRERLAELNRQLGVQLPVYVVVTKSDMLAGFAEFFDDLGRDEREQVWGVTFPLADRENTGDAANVDSPLQRFPDEFRLLHRQLQDRVLQRMQQETDVRRRALIYAFPQQFAGIESALQRFLDDAFGESRFARAAMLRGVYFTSGTQTGRPLDRMMSAMAASLGLQREVLLTDSSSGRAYFVKRLLRDVIFEEAGIAGSNPRVERRRARFQQVAIGVIGVLLAAGLIGLFASDRANRRFVEESRQQIAALTQRAQQTTAGDDPLTILPLLDAARDLPGGEAERAAGHDAWWAKLGLDQRQKLGLEAQRVYQRLLRQTLLPIVVQRMEEQLRRGDADNPATQYEALRAYLMLGDPTHFDPAALRVWAMHAWQGGALQNATDAQRASIDRHLEALFRPGQFDANLPLDQNLIGEARATLNRVPLAQRLDGRIEQQLAQLRLPDFTIAKAAGSSGLLVFVRKSGAPLTQGVNGAYTRAGFDAFVRLREAALADLSKDDWVLGRAEARPDPGGTDALRAALTQIYSEQTIRQWDGLLADVAVVPFSAPDQGARIANLLGSPTSPLRGLIQAAARETTFTPAPAPPGKLDALKQNLGNTLGTGGGAAAAPAPTLVDTHFQPLHELAGPPLDEAINAFKDAAATLQAEDTARKQSLPLPATGPLDRLKLLAQNAPAPLAAVLQGVAGNSDTVELQSQRAQLRALWAASVAPACRQALDGRFPLVRTSTRDAAPDDFARILAPGGLIDDFFQKNLQNRVDTSGAVWKWRPEAKSLGIPDDVPVQFQNAAMLRDALFRDGGRDVSVRFTVKVASLDPSLKRFVLDIDGQQLTATSDAPNATAAFQWPSGKGTAQAHVELDPAQSTPPRADGPWALFHLFDAARIQQSGQADHFNVSFDGGRVSLALVANSVNNPFRAGVLDRFRCPASL